MRRRVLAVAALCGAVGCSLTSLSGLSGGEEPDSGLPPRDDAGDESATDTDGVAPPAPPPPSREPPPAAGDAGRPPDASKDGPFCSTQPNTVVLCDDFERPTSNVVGPWTRTGVNLGGLELLADGGSTYGTYAHASLAHLTANPTGNDVTAFLERDVDSPVSEVESRFRIAIDAAPTDGYIHLMNLTYLNADGSYTSVYLLVTAADVKLYEQWFPLSGSPPATPHPLASPVAAGAWHDVRLHVVSTTPQHAKLTVDGVVLVDTALASTLVPAKLHAYAGIRFTAVPTGPLSVRIDDVALDVLR